MTVPSPLVLAIAAALAVAAPATAGDEERPRHRLEAGAFHWRSSTLGDDRADVSGVELRWSASARRWSWSIAVPALEASGSGVYTILGPGGGPVAGPGGSAGPAGPGGRAGSGEVSAAVATDTARRGIGDVRLQFGHRMGKDGPVGRFDLHGGVKLPTADEERGLGSGETDVWGGIGWLREGWSLDVEAFLDWVQLGDPDGVTLRDGAGGGVRLELPTRIGTYGAGVEVWPAVFDGDPTRALAVLSARGRARARSSWSIEVATGLTDSAPDFGFGLVWRQGVGK